MALWVPVCLAGIWGLVSFTIPAIALDGPYQTKSFQELLNGAIRAGNSVDQVAAAKQLALTQPAAPVAPEAVGFVASHGTWSDDLALWMKTYSAENATTQAGFVALDSLLTHMVPNAALELATQWVNEHPKAAATLAAYELLLRHYVDTSDQTSLTETVSRVTTDFPLEQIRSGKVNSDFLNAVEACGEPEWTVRLTAARKSEDTWHNCVADFVSSTKAPGADLKGVQSSLSVAEGVLPNLFRADYYQDSATFATEATKFSEALKALSGPNSAQSADFAALLAFQSDMVDGICLRLQRTETFFLEGTVTTALSLHFMFQSILETLGNEVKGDPSKKQTAAEKAKLWAGQLFGAGLGRQSEFFYLFAVQNAQSTETRSSAAFELGKLYLNNWNALAQAEIMLQTAVRVGAEPRVYLLLVQILYKEEKYPEALDVLSQYSKLEKDQIQLDRAQFVRGQLLGKLGKPEDRKRIWEGLYSTTKDSNLKQELEKALKTLKELDTSKAGK